MILDANRTHFLHLDEGLDYIIEQPGLVADFIRYLGTIQDSCIMTGNGGQAGPSSNFRDFPPMVVKIISGIFPSWFGMPILVQKECIGFFLLGSQRPMDYSDMDLQFIQALVDQTVGPYPLLGST